MRNMTQGEVQSWYEKAEWPCGHGNEYLAGPSGGIMQNIKCPVCGMEMNVTDHMMGFDVPFGQVISEPEGYVPPTYVAPKPVEIVSSKLASRIMGYFRRFA